MSSDRKTPNPTTQRLLWGMTAGRCEKCGRLLYKHPLSDTVGNFAQIAHNYPVGGKGPRIKFKRINSEVNIDSIDNLLLLCYDCHHEVDKIRPEDYPPYLLAQIKHDFEEFVVKATNVRRCVPTVAIKYSPNLHGSQLQIVGIQKALFPDKYIDRTIELTLLNSSTYTKDNALYWENEERNLTSNFISKVEPLLENASTAVLNFSVFGFGPIPLLAKLGALITNKREVDVYQLRKTPPSWEWETGYKKIEYKTSELKKVAGCKDIILLFSLSGKVSLENVRESIDFEEGSIYEMFIDDANDDYLRTREHLSDFIVAYRQIKEKFLVEHRGATIHIFAAVPVSVAIEIGRQRNPASDLPLVIYNYDQNKYTKAIVLGLIGGKNEQDTK